jgi:hypothetical protein
VSHHNPAIINGWMGARQCAPNMDWPVAGSSTRPAPQLINLKTKL